MLIDYKVIGGFGLSEEVLEDVGALVIGEEFVEFGFRVDVGADG
jgi:hypothetical protein